MASEGFAAMLQHDRHQWEAFGVLPGAGRLRLYLDRADASAVTECDAAFLLLAWADVVLAAQDIDDEGREEREHVLGELAWRLRSDAVSAEAPEPLASGTDYRIASATTASAFATENGWAALAWLTPRQGGSRAGYGRFALDGGGVLEVLIEAGHGCKIRESTAAPLPRWSDYQQEG